MTTARIFSMEAVDSYAMVVRYVGDIGRTREGKIGNKEAHEL
jgi:hypothetical protein